MREQFNRLLSDVMAYYKQDLSEFVLDVWWQACKGCDIDQISSALSRHATDPERGQFAPKVADIVRLLHGTPTDRAQVAWSKTLNAISRIGPWRDVVFDDPIIHAVIEGLGGWPKLCDIELDELGYLQHRFCEGYKAFARQGVQEYPRLLRGRRSNDEHFLKIGMSIPKPDVVGNIEQARLVYKGGLNGRSSQFHLQHLIGVRESESDQDLSGRISQIEKSIADVTK